MITPVVHEAEWMLLLSDLPRWQPPDKPTIVISPHPDDETLGSGGLIARLRSEGTEVTVIAVTDGENAYGDGPGLGEIREREQINALGKLGVDPQHVIRIRLPDSGLMDCESRLVEVLQSVVSPNAHIVAPWRLDFHPDHEACGRAAEAIAREKEAQLTSYFFWTWHRAIHNGYRACGSYRFRWLRTRFARSRKRSVAISRNYSIQAALRFFRIICWGPPGALLRCSCLHDYPRCIQRCFF